MSASRHTSALPAVSRLRNAGKRKQIFSTVPKRENDRNGRGWLIFRDERTVGFV